MNSSTHTVFHSVDEEWLASYCGGGLSRAKRLLISCQATLKPEVSSRLAAIDEVGGALFQSAQGQELSGDFFARVMDKIDVLPKPGMAESLDKTQSQNSGRLSWVPGPLEDFLTRSRRELKWKNLGLGVERAALSNDNGEELYLLKAPPGLKLPRHTHGGEEWALILQGGYHVGDTAYGHGDLHREDENCVHAPIVDNDKEACITLVAIEGGLKFSNPILRFLKPVIGI